MPQPYPDEIELGLGECIADGTLTYLCSLEPNSGEFEDSERELLAGATVTIINDLYRFRSILMRTGFNLNGDFFPNDHTWAARKTIINKPCNLRHQKLDILGHQVAAKMVDKDLVEIPDDVEEVPSSFSIYDESVIYLSNGPKERKEQVAKLVKEIEDGKWWVSLEVSFGDSDYIVVDCPPSGKYVDADLSTAQIIKRTPETAKLSQYLLSSVDKNGKRGTGKLPNGQLIGRVIKDFFFTGKGIVEVPGNPSSAIHTMEDKPLSGNVKRLGYTISELIGNQQMEEKIATLEAALAEAKASLANKVSQLEATEAELLASKATLAKLQEEADKQAKAARLQSFTFKVKDAYKLEDEAKASEIANDLFALSDEAFEKHLKTMAQIKTEKSEVAVASIVPVVEEKTAPVSTETVVSKKSKYQTAIQSMFTKKGDK